MISKMEFQCKLAHQDDVKRISDFNSIKELYERISQTFQVEVEQILYCTLNTHDFRDMNSLLGNYLSLGDMIVVHMCGKSKELTLTKTQQYLGLTITDNAHGRAFIKKINQEQETVAKLVRPGDHIAAVNLESTIGMRHYEVAKMLREVPQNTSFKLVLIEPLHLEDFRSNPSTLNRTSNKSSYHENNSDLNSDQPSISLLNISSDSTSASRFDVPNLNDYSNEDLAKSSLPISQLLSKSTSNQLITSKSSHGNQLTNDHRDHQNEEPHSYRRVIERINLILESFLGINDNILAIKIYRLARENQESFDQFAKALEDSELAIFNFNREIANNLWQSAARISVE